MATSRQKAEVRGYHAIKRTEVDRTTVSADYAKSTQDNASGKTTIEAWWRAKAKYDYFISPKWHRFVDGRYERDVVALLDRRMVLGGGACHPVKEFE